MEEIKETTAEKIDQEYMGSNDSYDLPQDEGESLEAVEGELPEVEEYNEEEGEEE